MYTGTALVDRIIRPDPSNTNPGIGTVPRGAIIEGDRKVNQWIRLTKVNGVPVQHVESWVSTGPNSEYISWREVPGDTPPEPPIPPTPAPETFTVTQTLTITNNETGESWAGAVTTTLVKQ